MTYVTWPPQNYILVPASCSASPLSYQLDPEDQEPVGGDKATILAVEYGGKGHVQDND